MAEHNDIPSDTCAHWEDAMLDSNENRSDYGIIDLFAGPGGWDEALASMGHHDVLGIEYDEPCCRTREAAGHATLHANVAELDPLEYAGIDGLIASPPCQAWSMAGKRGGELDKVLVYHVLEQLSKGRDVRAEARKDAADERSLLVVEPLRWALALRPRWVAFEQVEPVLELWKYMADILRAAGYSAWAGVLSAERYGVPQTRKRAFLIASLDVPVSPPLPTHQAYRNGEPAEHVVTLEGELLPWISMAQALGWGFGEQPAPTVSGGGGRDNGIGVFAGQAQRERLRGIVAAEKAMGAGMIERHGDRPGRSIHEPAFTVRANAGGQEPGGFRWKLDTHRDQREDGSTQTRPVDAPAPALPGKAGGQWKWTHERPAPTIVGARRSKDGGLVGRQLPRGEGENIGGHGWGEAEREDDPKGLPAVRVSLAEALTLQSFRPDYPVQGNQGQQFQQVGNAIPPLLAGAVLAALIDTAEAEAAA